MDKKRIKLAISVDDIHNEEGFGKYPHEKPMKFLKDLNEEFGLKFTLFVVPCWHGKYQLDGELLEFLKENQEWIEVSAHGFTHYHKNPKHSMEFKDLKPEEIYRSVNFSAHTFKSKGLVPKGFKAPGWFFPEPMLKLIIQNFEYIMEDFRGTRPIYIKLPKGRLFRRVPFTESIHEIGRIDWSLADLEESDSIILHSHFGVGKSNPNNWNDELFEKVRWLVKKLNEKYEVVPTFVGEVS